VFGQVLYLEDRHPFLPEDKADLDPGLARMRVVGNQCIANPDEGTLSMVFTFVRVRTHKILRILVLAKINCQCFFRPGFCRRPRDFTHGDLAPHPDLPPRRGA